jgi:hypothetical protein
MINSSCEISPANTIINTTENSNILLFIFCLINPNRTNPQGSANNISGFVIDPLFKKALGSLTSNVLRPPKSIKSKTDSDEVTSLLPVRVITCTQPNPEPSINKHAANIAAFCR